MKVPLPPFDRTQMAAEDARSIVPVMDEYGGLMIYRRGRPAYYCLNGEWFEAVDVGVPPSETVETQLAGVFVGGAEDSSGRVLN